MSASLAQALGGAPVFVGTENAAKLEAVRAALASLSDHPERLSIHGLRAASHVPEQPVGWEEIAAGARNRARAALAWNALAGRTSTSAVPHAGSACVLAFGIEDGLVELPVPQALDLTATRAAVFNIGCAWVTDGEREGTGFSSGFAYPPAASAPAIGARSPIGDLFDALWQAHRGTGRPVGGLAEDVRPVASGRQGGNIGQLTQGRLDRSAYGAQAILCALVPFLHVDLYD